MRLKREGQDTIEKVDNEKEREESEDREEGKGENNESFSEAKDDGEKGEDLDDDCAEELSGIDQTMAPHHDEEIVEGINLVKDFCRSRSKSTRLPLEAGGVQGSREEATTDDKDIELEEVNDAATEFDNSDPGRFDYEIEEYESRVVRSVRPSFQRYVEKCKEVHYFVGLCFTDHKQFNRSLKKYFIQEKRYYIFQKNESRRVRVICKDQHYKWLICAAWENRKDKHFLIKTYYHRHTCNQVFKISGIRAHWIAEQYE